MPDSSAPSRASRCPAPRPAPSISAAAGDSPTKPGKAGRRELHLGPRRRPATDFTGNTGSAGGLWTETPDYHWAQNPEGKALSYVSPKLKSNTTVVGAGALQAWIRARSRTSTSR